MPLGIITAGIPVIDDCEVLTRMKVFVTQLGVVPTLEHTLRDQAGQPLDVSEYFDTSEAEGHDSTVVLRCKELVAEVGTRNPVLEVTGDCLDPVSGLLQFDLTRAMVKQAGIYQLSVALKNPDGDIKHIENPLLWVERSLFGATTKDNSFGPPSMQELRQALMDSAGENVLLDGSEFFDDQLAFAVGRPIEQWNSDPPPLRPLQDTRTFPFREQWLRAICGHLLVAAANNYRRNHLPYQAGGMSIDDKNKEGPYLQTGLKLLEDWTAWVRAAKYRINTASFDGQIGSTYGALAGNGPW